MKVKIIEPGWETFSESLGLTEFTNGVSDEISRREALMLGAMVRVVEIDNDGNEIGIVSPAHEVLLNQTISAAVVEELPREEEPAVEESAEAEAEPEPVKPAEPAKIYSKEELLEIAEKEGIQGVRKIGDVLGVKNNSIRGLIAEILAKQTEA